MRATGRPGRGERARVAERVRDLLGGDDPDARTPPLPRPAAAAPSSWLPGSDFDRHVPRRGDPPRPAWRGRLRWDPGRRGATALGVAVVAVVAATGWWLAASRPREVPLSAAAGSTPGAAVQSAAVGSSPTTGSTAGSGSAARPAPATSAPVVVDVAGKVRHPGIYTLTAGARVYDALRAAGGARRGVSTLSLNLAAPLQDGQQILVGTAHGPVAPGGGSSGTGGGASGTSGPAAIVDLNAATLEQLETLPGVGPVLGQHILDWRDAHGQFASVDQLREVSGIGDVRMAQLRPLVTV